MLPAAEQLKRLKQGIVDLVSEKELLAKLEKSVKSGKKIPHKQRRSAGTGMMITAKASERDAFEDALDQCVADEMEGTARQEKAKKGSRPVLRDGPGR